jgi:hypothetical protein
VIAGREAGISPAVADELEPSIAPTDVMPLTHRAKYIMLVQSTVALALFGLIVARAVHAFT